MMVGNFNAQAAKSIAILRGIQFNIDCGLFPCVFESDAKVVVRWINEKSHMDSTYGGVLEDIIYASTEMNDVRFGFIHRQGNQVAHLLANNALFLRENRYWMEEFPSCISVSVQADMHV